MNILIVCNHFYPHNRIAAFRLNAFARYFREAGHSVTVITEGDRDETAMWNGCEVHYVKDPVITSSKQESLLQRRKKWAFRRILSALQFRLFLDYKRIWQFKACKKAQKLAKSRQFDVVLSSYGHLSSHRIAYRLHRKTPFYWIADMRDEMSKWPWLLPINSRRLLFYERRILKDADLILSVSAPLVEDFKQIGGGIDKVIEITNGYDYEEVHDVSFQPVYTMAFIGHFYNSITPDKWFGAFSELVAEGALPSDSRILIIGNTSPLAVPENIRQNVFQIRQVDHDGKASTRASCSTTSPPTNRSSPSAIPTTSSPTCWRRRARVSPRTKRTTSRSSGCSCAAIPSGRTRRCCPATGTRYGSTAGRIRSAGCSNIWQGRKP